MSEGTLAEVLAGAADWCLVGGDNAKVLPTLPEQSVDHVITDPPYSSRVHSLQRRMLRGSGGRVAAGQASGRGEVGFAPLGFDALTSEAREEAARGMGAATRRWVLVFSDVETVHEWASDLECSGFAKNVRVGAWVKIAGQPQLSGDRPAVGFEAIQISHHMGEKCRWNGGGHPAVWSHLIATDRNGHGDRVHTTQKPIPLMLDLVADFTDPGEIILDAFAGSGTTGVACLRLGRRFIGIEKDPKCAAIARERLRAEANGLTLRDARAGQLPMFGAK